MDGDNRLGEFLRARRELTRPQEVGLRHLGRRRTPGLRREEVAMLAGVSTDYYVRLEQGRDRRPSEQVLDALARALRLDDESVAHLYRLAAPAPRRAAPYRTPETLSPIIRRLLAGWGELPAQVLGMAGDVLGANALAEALYGDVLRSGEADGNLLRFVFLDPVARDFYNDWEECLEDAVADLRMCIGTDPDHPRLTEVIGELALRSPEFARLWARHDVRGKTHAIKHIDHPLVGELSLNYLTFTVNGTARQRLIIYQAEPGSPSEEALNLLGSLVAEGDYGRPGGPNRLPHPPDRS